MSEGGSSMQVGIAVRKNEYYDSVFLMGINKQLSETPGVEQTAVVMATNANKRLLAEIGIAGPEIDSATANDLVVAVLSRSGNVTEDVIDSLDEALRSMAAKSPASDVRTLRAGFEQRPDANLAVFSIPGDYVADEAGKALEVGMNVFIFSSNVPLERELELKQIGEGKGLLVMGPDCGTSILNGIGIGFANAVRRGTIGAVGPSGTGLQEFTSQVHNAGGGISHAIGTGSNDLSDAIGGLTTLAAMRLLDADPDTELIAIIAKPPGAETLAALRAQTVAFTKPLIGCFLGLNQSLVGEFEPFQLARTIDEASDMALTAAGIAGAEAVPQDRESEQDLAKAAVAGWSDEQRYLRGVFAGGTFCYQSQQILQDAGIDVYSNSPIQTELKLDHPDISRQHTLVDMGDEHYTLGKLHPMIDAAERAKRILAEAADPDVAILLLDFILGYNAASDPVGDLMESLQEAMAIRRNRGGDLTIVASVCGTKQDPQDMDLQIEMLKECGVLVFPSNARATAFCRRLLGQV
ncbi:MAG: hypothetical protein ACC700_10970 [Anaerolineales bacterium]